MTYSPETILARRVLLDALEALAMQSRAVVLVGAQAVYLRTGTEDVPIATNTVDADLAIQPALLVDEPRLEAAMLAAGFSLASDHPQPGAWRSHTGVAVDLMVPASLASAGGHRGARIPPHSKRATRNTPGLEAALIDRDRMELEALSGDDHRKVGVDVAGIAALAIAKLHKLGERLDAGDRAPQTKDAHDLFRLLRATEADELADTLRGLLNHPACRASVLRAGSWASTYGGSPEATLPRLAAETEGFAVSAERRAFVAISTAALLREFVAATRQ